MTLSRADTSTEPQHSRLSSLAGLGWFWRVWLIVALFGTLTLVRSHQIGIPIRDPHNAYFPTRVLISLVILVVLALIDAIWRARRAGTGVRGLVPALRERWTPSRIVLAVLGICAYYAIYLCYHNLKSWDVFNNPKDQMLLDWDRWLFLGHSPAVLLHSLLGQGYMAHVLRNDYEAFSAILAVGVVMPLVYCRQIRQGFVMIASGMWIWILGVGTYYAIPSLGPFQSAPQEFDGLPHMSIQDTQARYMAQRAQMLADPHAHDSFAQISAFSSLHCALTMLLLLMAIYYRQRLFTWLLSFQLIGTLIATVYLGWHFAVDDIAGVAIAILGVWLGIKTIGARRPDAR